MSYNQYLQNFLHYAEEHSNFSQKEMFDNNRVIIEKKYNIQYPINYIFNPQKTSNAILHNITTARTNKREDDYITLPVSTNYVINSEENERTENDYINLPVSTNYVINLEENESRESDSITLHIGTSHVLNSNDSFNPRRPLEDIAVINSDDNDLMDIDDDVEEIRN